MSGSCMRVGQSACDGSPGTIGWQINAQHQLQAPINGSNGEALCLSTGSDQNQAWPFTSPIPTSHGKYDGSLHDVGVGSLLANCSSAQARGNWSFNASAKTLQLATGANQQPKCLAAKAMASTGAFFGGPKPSVTQVDQCPDGPQNTSQMTLTTKGEIAVGDGSVCVTATPLYGLSLWSKPLGNGTVAALILNLLEDIQTGTVPLADIPGATPQHLVVLDVWSHKTTTLSKPQLEVTLRPHQSAFVILSDAAANVQPSATFYSENQYRGQK